MALRSRALFGCVIVLSVTAATGSAMADDAALARSGDFARTGNVSVLQRPKPEYDPVTFHTGAFYVAPSAAVDYTYNDNYLAASSSSQPASFFTVSPAVALKSDWVRNSLAAVAHVETNLYTDRSAENATAGGVNLAYRWDIHRDLGAAFGVDAERLTESRTSANSVFDLKKPEQYNQVSAYTEAIKQFNRVRVFGRADVQDFAYDNNTSTGGTTVYQRDRDHTIVSGDVKAEYAYLPAASVFVDLVMNQRSYRNAVAGEVLRNSSGYELTVGSNFDLTHLLRGEVYVGYLNQSYDKAIYKTINGASVRGRLEYFPSELTTLTLAAKRSVEDAGIANVSGYLLTEVSARVDHELKRNLVLSASATYSNNDYGTYDRKDHRWDLQASASYLISRAIQFRVSFDRFDQSSSGIHAAPNFTVNKVSTGLAYRF